MTVKVHIDTKDSSCLGKIIDDANITTPLVAVYCGSRSGNRPSYTKVAYQLGQALAENGFGLVYGGASIGVMGAVADGVIIKNGVAVGVIPTFLLQKEIAHDNLAALYTTDTMHTRKALMAGFASAFVVLSGGLGTLEEIMEIATWRQLYQHEKPMIVVNTDGFYDRLFDHLSHTVAEGFMKQEDLDRFIVCQSVDEVMVKLQSLITLDNNIAVQKI